MPDTTFITFVDRTMRKPTGCTRTARIAVTVAVICGFLFALRFIGWSTPESRVMAVALLVGNAPGFAIAALPFVVLGGASTAHGGDAAVVGLVVMFLGNGIGYGVLTYFIACRKGSTASSQ